MLDPVLLEGGSARLLPRLKGRDVTKPESDPFLDDLETLIVDTRRCAFGKWIAGLTEERAAGVRNALAMTHKDFSNVKMLAFARRHGFEFGETVIRDHRAGDCACVR